MDMTLGQRIQQLRKDKGLSQEALGETLNVSRQAISKWESDTTIPEIDKLIALSRLFELPVGVLLGVEEGSPEHSGELSSRELAAVEEIVGRYLAHTVEQGPKRPSRRRIRSLVLTGAAGLVLAALTSLTVTQAVQLHRLNDRLDGLQGNVAGLEATIQNSIVSVQDPPAGESGFLADWDCQVTNVNVLHETMTLMLSATPSVYVEGMELSFTAKADGEELVTVQAEEQSERHFTAVLTVPFHEKIRLTASLLSENGWQAQALGVMDGWSIDTAFLLILDASGTSGWARGEPNVWTVDWTLRGRFSLVGTSLYPYDVVSAQIRAYRSGTLVQETQLDMGRDDGAPTLSQTAYQASIPVSAGDDLSFELEYIDNYGTVYACTLESVRFSTGDGGELKADVILELQNRTFRGESSHRS